jgi:ABC-2 type transport system permease protein
MDFGPILAGYFGIALMGAAWLAIGVLASTLARNQVVAFVTAFVATIMSFAIGFAESLFPGAPQWAHDGLRYVSFQAAFEPFPRGVVDTRAVVYFLTIAVVALFLSVRVLESRKWR